MLKHLCLSFQISSLYCDVKTMNTYILRIELRSCKDSFYSGSFFFIFEWFLFFCFIQIFKFNRSKNKWTRKFGSKGIIKASLFFKVVNFFFFWLGFLLNFFLCFFNFFGTRFSLFGLFFC